MSKTDTPSPYAQMAGSDSLRNALEMTGCENEENLIDMANVGSSLMERIDSLVSMPGPYHRWSPADDPAEIVFDLVNDVDEIREENAKLRDALEQIAGKTGQFAIPFPDGQEGYPAFAVMTARAALSPAPASRAVDEN